MLQLTHLFCQFLGAEKLALPIQMLLECMSVVLGGAAATLQGRSGCLLTLFAQRFLEAPPTLQLRIRPRTLCFSSRQVGGLTFPKSNRRTCSDLSPAHVSLGSVKETQQRRGYHRRHNRRFYPQQQRKTFFGHLQTNSSTQTGCFWENLKAAFPYSEKILCF